MSKQIFFKPNDDLPHEYVKYVALQFASQIGTANFATLGITSIDFDGAELEGMRGPGCIVHFSEPVAGCNAVAVVLYCDLYQIASGNVSGENDHVYFDVKRLYRDVDCFQLADVLGEIRGVKTPYRLEPLLVTSDEKNGASRTIFEVRHAANV